MLTFLEGEGLVLVFLLKMTELRVLSVENRIANI